MSVNVVDELKSLAAEMKDLAKKSHPAVVKAMGQDGVALVQLGFELGESPDGKPWEPPKYRPGGRPLRDSGRLMGSVTDPDEALTLTKRGFEVGTNVIYAGVHQFGWEDRNIPARPFLPDPDNLPADWERSIDAAADKALERLAGK